MSKPAQYLWHPGIRESWAKEKLVYWQISFQDSYTRKTVYDVLDQFLQECNIHSYTIYELSGHIDILIRVWVPAHLRKL